MQTLNEALDVLKSYLPLEYLVAPSNDREVGKNSQSAAILKLTKIDTLKLATKYIGILTDLLLSENGGQPVGELDLSSRWSWSYAATESASSTESLSPSLAVSSSSPSFQPVTNSSSSSSNGFNAIHHHSNHQQQFMNVYQNSSSPMASYSSTQLLNSQDIDRFYY